MSEGSTKFLIGAAIGAVGGFALGSAAASPTAKSAGQSAVRRIGDSARLVGRSTAQGFKEFGSTLETGYTKIRGREAYLEHEIDQLRDKILDLEERLD